MVTAGAARSDALLLLLNRCDTPRSTGLTGRCLGPVGQDLAPLRVRQLASRDPAGAGKPAVDVHVDHRHTLVAGRTVQREHRDDFVRSEPGVLAMSLLSDLERS